MVKLPFYYGTRATVFLDFAVLAGITEHTAAPMPNALFRRTIPVDSIKVIARMVKSAISL